MLPRAFSIKHIDESERSEARQTLKFNITVSFLPLIVSFVILIFPGSSFDYTSILQTTWMAFRTVFLSGQLYFYAMSICGTIVLIALRDGLESARWMRLWSVAFVLFCVAFMVVFITQNQDTKPSFSFHSVFSVLFFIASVVIYYRVMLLAEVPPKQPEESNRAAAVDVTNAAVPQYD